ncbi:hypothetical protein WJX81_006267 [Elliptochloris bilobata]|uniref:Uncharacterized protein n=1 Tax=Elliptochloris bilobata TaxID=381761 RepID=A0AAW1SBB0_9CHLO
MSAPLLRRRQDVCGKGRWPTSRLGAVRLGEAGFQPGGVEVVQPLCSPTISGEEKQAIPLRQGHARCARGRGMQGAPESECCKAGTWGAVQKTLQVITDKTLDVASSRLSSMALGAVSLKDSYIIDKGRDAWNAVGGAAVEVATTLDSAVEQLLEGWTSPLAGVARGSSNCDAGRASGNCREAHSARAPQIHAAPPADAGKARPGGLGRGKENAPAASADLALHDPLPAGSTGPSQPGRAAATSAALAAAELEALQAAQAEYAELRDQLQRVQAKLQATSSKCTALAQENSLLRERTSPAAASPPVDDALTEQVAAQLHALLQEKAMLASENERLLRENCGLQELLQYTVSAGDSGGEDDVTDSADWPSTP